jgi:hypothetical protein
MRLKSLSLPVPGEAAHPAAADPAWKSLYLASGVAALVLVALTLGQFVSYTVAPPPLEGTAAEWFALFQRSAVWGLLAVEALLIVYAVLSVLVSLALCAALWRVSPSLTAPFLLLSLMSGLTFIAARPALEMLALSGQYAAATTDAQRAAFLAAGEGLVATFHGTAFEVSYLLGSVAGLLIAVVMLRSRTFSKTTAYLRLASSVLDFGLVVPGIGLVISLGSVVCLLLFNLLVARRLWQLGRAA